MTDVNDIKAGTYLLVAPIWEEYTSRPGEPFDFVRHRRGAVLDLDVEQARRLVLAKAVIDYDADNPTHVVNADGSVSLVEQPDPATTGLVIPKEQLDTLRAEYGIPADAGSEDLVAFIKGLQSELAAARASADSGDRPKSDRVKDVLEWVGTDRERAQTALDGERSTKGDKARPELVNALLAVSTNGAS